MDDVDMAKYMSMYNCGIVEGDPQAFIDMKSGDRFVYSHGQVIAFYSHDAMDFPEREHPYTYPGIDQDRAKSLRFNQHDDGRCRHVGKTDH